MAPILVVRQLPSPVPGICGLVVDQRYEALERDLDWVEVHGIEVERVDPVSEPDALRGAPEADVLWRARGAASLPMLLIDGHVVSNGRFPSRHELAHVLATRRTPLNHELLNHLAALAASAAVGAATNVAREREVGRAAGLNDEELDAIVGMARAVVSTDAPSARCR